MYKLFKLFNKNNCFRYLIRYKIDFSIFKLYNKILEPILIVFNPIIVQNLGGKKVKFFL